MPLLINILLLIVGFYILIKGADFFVVSSASIARRANISPLIIGLTLVAFGTSLPELAVSFLASITAMRQGLTADIALGNVVGSNIANITLILGASALVLPTAVDRSIFKKEIPFLIAVSICLAFFAIFRNDFVITRFESFLLLMLFALYMYIVIKGSKKTENIEDDIKIIDKKKQLILLILGLGGVTLGGYLVTYSAELISMDLLVGSFGFSVMRAKTLVGLSVVSLGTSLPELVTSMVAAKKGESQIAVGNVIGSNVFNSLLIVGLSGLVAPLGVNADVRFDLILVIFITLIMVVLVFHKRMITKANGFTLLFIYVLYITFIILRASNVIVL
jgi:cation:H+ antiporter